MIKNNVRPYEMSLWTLQDSFITVLKPIGSSFKGQIETPKTRLKNNGTLELSFSIPMYYYNSGEKVENPLWYDAHSGVLMVNMRKIKVIFNKGENGEKVFEFVITEITETHTDGQLHCEVKAEGLAFQELGKIGYKISFNADLFNQEYEEWFGKTVGTNTENESFDYSTEDEKNAAEPINNINYWADKAFKNSAWKYEVRMDWSSYDGIINETDRVGENNVRQSNKIYDEEYIASWETSDNGTIRPREKVSFQEKRRFVEAEKSNLYNISQSIAEAFGVYCKYEYEYDENYHIIGRTCVFYNNFLDEASGKIDINYPYDASKIERTMDTTDIVTKMFVVPMEDDSSPSGLVTIADVAANKSREDYILNFDYLYSIGTINEEQYAAIDDYERAMLNYNSEIEPLAQRIAQIELDLVQYNAELTVTQNSQTYAKEQMEQSIALMNSITGGDGELEKTIDTPYRGVLLPDDRIGEGWYYIKITQEGVLEDTIALYDNDKNLIPNESGLNYSITKDSNGNVNGIDLLHNVDESKPKIYYITFTYRPKLYYENVYSTFSRLLAQNLSTESSLKEKIENAETELETAREEYKSKIEEKESIIASFERMMGAALKEGSWQPEANAYHDYGDKYLEVIKFGGNNDSKHLSAIWDSEPFEGEQLPYYEEGPEQEPVYYPCIILSEDSLSIIKPYMDKISYVCSTKYDDGTDAAIEYMTIGAEMVYCYINNGTDVSPALMLTQTPLPDYWEENGRISVITLAPEGKITEEELINNLSIVYADKINYTMVYPRFEINSLLLKTSEDQLSIMVDNTELQNYYDYSVLIRDESYYITLDEKVLINYGLAANFDISYVLSNAALSLYLDALEVSKTNAFPQVSYSIDVAAMNEQFIREAYNKLNKIVSINDRELKFENVQGYISELELDLDKPWKDTITIQNYRTKFEDLFSTIVASSEQMKANAPYYNNAASAFTPGGTIRQDVLQTTLNKTDLSYAFQNGKLTIDQNDGIWATSDDGVVAMRGGGIFAANQKDQYGNWLWNTGITPNGINASLLTAGQIDTNLIKVYAGDNLRFQLNAEGLFAYRQQDNGEANLDEYVVHNSDGLFLKQEGTDKVEVSWDGLVLRNNEGEKTFYADPSTGNLVLAGGATIAKGSQIAGWTIEETALVSNNRNSGLASSGSAIGDYDVIWAGGRDNFRVESDGTLFAQNAVIKGTVQTGSFIGDVSVSALEKGIEIINFNGNTFTISNPNLDGNERIEPAYLRFQIKLNGLTTEEIPDNYTFFLNDEEITDNVIIDSYLTFTLNNSIDEGIIKVYGNGGQEYKEGVLENRITPLETSFTIEKNYIGSGSILSNISPQSYNFTEDSQEAEFSITLTENLAPENGSWLINGVEVEGSDGENEDKLTISKDSLKEGEQQIITYVYTDTVNGLSATRTAFVSRGQVLDNEAQMGYNCFFSNECHRFKKSESGEESFSTGYTDVKVYYGSTLLDIVNISINGESIKDTNVSSQNIQSIWTGNKDTSKITFTAEENFGKLSNEETIQYFVVAEKPDGGKIGFLKNVKFFADEESVENKDIQFIYDTNSQNAEPIIYHSDDGTFDKGVFTIANVDSNYSLFYKIDGGIEQQLDNFQFNVTEAAVAGYNKEIEIICKSGNIVIDRQTIPIINYGVLNTEINENLLDTSYTEQLTIYVKDLVRSIDVFNLEGGEYTLSCLRTTSIFNTDYSPIDSPIDKFLIEVYSYTDEEVSSEPIVTTLFDIKNEKQYFTFKTDIKSITIKIYPSNAALSSMPEGATEEDKLNIYFLKLEKGNVFTTYFLTDEQINNAINGLDNTVLYTYIDNKVEAINTSLANYATLETVTTEIENGMASFKSTTIEPLSNQVNSHSEAIESQGNSLALLTSSIEINATSASPYIKISAIQINNNSEAITLTNSFTKITDKSFEIYSNDKKKAEITGDYFVINEGYFRKSISLLNLPETTEINQPNITSADKLVFEWFDEGVGFRW